MNRKCASLPATAAASLPDALRHFDERAASSLADVKTLADYLGVSINTVWRWSRTGRLPAPIKIGPNSTRWRVGDVRAALAALGNSGEAR